VVEATALRAAIEASAGRTDREAQTAIAGVTSLKDSRLEMRAQSAKATDIARMYKNT